MKTSTVMIDETKPILPSDPQHPDARRAYTTAVEVNVCPRCDRGEK